MLVFEKSEIVKEKLQDSKKIRDALKLSIGKKWYINNNLAREKYKRTI